MEGAEPFLILEFLKCCEFKEKLFNGFLDFI